MNKWLIPSWSIIIALSMFSCMRSTSTQIKEADLEKSESWAVVKNTNEIFFVNGLKEEPIYAVKEVTDYGEDIILFKRDEIELIELELTEENLYIKNRGTNKLLINLKKGDEVLLTSKVTKIYYKFSVEQRTKKLVFTPFKIVGKSDPFEHPSAIVFVPLRNVLNEVIQD